MTLNLHLFYKVCVAAMSNLLIVRLLGRVIFLKLHFYEGIFWKNNTFMREYFRKNTFL